MKILVIEDDQTTRKFIAKALEQEGFIVDNSGDGKEGLIFHVLQGFWYRFLIDSLIYENKKKRN